MNLVTLVTVYYSLTANQFFHFITERTDGARPSLVPNYNQSRFNNLPSDATVYHQYTTDDKALVHNRYLIALGSESLRVRPFALAA
jgi:hypothetical protein